MKVRKPPSNIKISLKVESITQKDGEFLFTEYVQAETGQPSVWDALILTGLDRFYLYMALILSFMILWGIFCN